MENTTSNLIYSLAKSLNTDVKSIENALSNFLPDKPDPDNELMEQLNEKLKGKILLIDDFYNKGTFIKIKYITFEGCFCIHGELFKFSHDTLIGDKTITYYADYEYYLKCDEYNINCLDEHIVNDLRTVKKIKEREFNYLNLVFSRLTE